LIFLETRPELCSVGFASAFGQRRGLETPLQPDDVSVLHVASCAYGREAAAHVQGFGLKAVAVVL